MKRTASVWQPSPDGAVLPMPGPMRAKRPDIEWSYDKDTETLKSSFKKPRKGTPKRFPEWKGTEQKEHQKTLRMLGLMCMLNRDNLPAKYTVLFDDTDDTGCGYFVARANLRAAAIAASGCDEPIPSMTAWLDEELRLQGSGGRE